MPSSFDPHKLLVLGLSVAAGALLSCSQNPVTVNLHAMQASSRVSFVCRGLDNSPTGHKLDECPDYEAGTRHTIALVTQTTTEEVAVVDLAAGTILDIDRTTPGYSFLRVRGTPGAIVTTPGGSATFVGVSGLQKNGIFALPTTCILPPTADEPARDLTTWPACHLSSEPGDIAVVIDPVMEGGKPRVTCPSAPPPTVSDDLPAVCGANTLDEGGPVAGRRKLLVALPNEHKLILLDAQRLLNQPPGAFPECQAEASFALNGDIPSSIAQKLPEDLQPLDSAACTPPPTYATTNMSALPTPGGFAALGDHVYVADTNRSVVHRLNVSDPCNATEEPPLLPVSYEQPWRAVTTSRVAVSPLSITSKNPAGQQFLYAIDQNDPQAASVMVFDLTKIDPKDDSTRTPIIFPGARRQPYLPVDRLRFNAPAKDVSFVLRDFPKPDGNTGAGQFGLTCEPDPNASPDDPATLYRPNADYSDGARPINLRGMFGFAMLSNGQVAIIDADDFDAPCRRPVTSNPGAEEDIHGCKNDPISIPYKLPEGNTVTGESSCNVVEQHRPRSATLSISSSTNGLRAPSVRTFPQFSTPGTTVLVTDQPRMMATDLHDPAKPDDPTATLPAQVNVNSQLYAHCGTLKGPSAPPPCDVESSFTPLVIDPKDPAAQNSLTLPLVEPRSYTADQSPQLVFEGPLFPARTSGYLTFEAGASEGVLSDRDASFCGAGVEDRDTIRARGVALGIPNGSLDKWSNAHADYVQISGDFPASDDQYWSVGRGQECARLINEMKPNVAGRDACMGQFGNVDTPLVLNARRNLSILEASAGQLKVTPQGCTGATCADIAAQLECCFPSGTAYTVRAANQWLVTGVGGVAMHDLATGAGGRCVHTASCDRRKELFGQRVFEVCDPNGAYEDFKCDVNTNPKVGCVGPDSSKTPTGLTVLPGGKGSACIFENLTSRFVVYRGAKPSVANMAFSWQTTGGFVPQTVSLLPLSSSVSPQSLGYLPEQGWLAVVDASTVGLALFDLNSLAVVSPSPYF